MAFGSMAPPLMPWGPAQPSIGQQGMGILQSALKQRPTGPGLIDAILKAQGQPVNPGAPPPPGSPDYVEGGQGPMAGGMPSGSGGFLGMMNGGGGLGMLSKLFGGG